MGRLIKIDLWHRCALGQGRKLEAYLAVARGLAGNCDFLQELLAEECLARAVFGMVPTMEEFANGSPALFIRLTFRASLARLLRCSATYRQGHAIVERIG